MFITPFSKKPFAISNSIALVLLLVILTIFSFFTIKEVYRIDYLFTKDPPYHMTLAQSMDANIPFSTSIDTYDGGVITTKYATLLRVSAVAIHEITDLSYIDIFKLYGIFTRLFSAALIFLIISKISKNQTIALITTILFLGARYVIFRAIITFPENLVIPFHLLIFYEVYKALKTHKIGYALPVYIAGAALVHYRSMVIPALFVVFLSVHVILTWYKERRVNSGRKLYPLKTIVSALIIFVVLSTPVIIDTVNIFLIYLKGNVGADSVSAVVTSGDTRYIPPSLFTYFGNFGYLLVFLVVVGVFAFILKRQKTATDWLVLVWFAFACILSQGTRFQLYVPTDRMLIYLILPSVLISFFALKEVVLIKCNYRIILLLLFLVSIGTLYTVTPTVSGWKAFKDHEINQVAWLNQNLSSGSNDVLLTSGVSYLNLGFTQFNILETRTDAYNAIKKNNQINLENVKNRYVGRHVYLAVNFANTDLIPPKNSKEVFRSNESVVYDLGLQ